MKQRKGFVSNSSSSSFIILISEETKCPHCGRSDKNLISLIDRNNNYEDTYIKEKGKESIIKYIEENWYDTHDVIRTLNYLDVGNKDLILLAISNHDDVIKELIRESKNIEIIYEDSE